MLHCLMVFSSEAQRELGFYEFWEGLSPDARKWWDGVSGTTSPRSVIFVTTPDVLTIDQFQKDTMKWLKAILGPKVSAKTLPPRLMDGGS